MARSQGEPRVVGGTLLASIHSWVSWLVGPVAATVLYLLLASLQLAMVGARATRRPQVSRPDSAPKP